MEIGKLALISLKKQGIFDWAYILALTFISYGILGLLVDFSKKKISSFVNGHNNNCCLLAKSLPTLCNPMD